MDSNIEKLLEKYWDAESSQGEEARLKSLLNDSADTEETEEVKALFEHFEAEKSITLDDSFDDELLAMIEAEPETKVVNFSTYFRRYASMAAAVLVLITSSYLFIKNENSYQAEDTFETPEAALEEVKKQLLMVSNFMNKGNQQIKEIGSLGKADTGLNDFSKMNQADQSVRTLGRMNITRTSN